MPSELKKPEPVAWRWRPSRVFDDWVFSDVAQAVEAGREFGRDFEQVYTDAQLEQYAADRVREALERAAQQIESGCPPLARRGNRIEIGHDARQAFAAAIRTLKEQTK